MNQEKKLTEKQRLNKKKLVLQITNEITELENKIKNVKTENFKINIIKGLKISLRVGQLITPYLLTAGISFGLFSILGGTPFFIDNRKQKSNIKKELDNFGNIRYEQQYDKFDNSANILSYYGKWVPAENDMYSRNVETYDLNELTEESILKILEGENTSLTEILGEPISKKIETKNNLTEDERVADKFLQAIIYDENNNDYIIVKETAMDNFLITALYFILTFLCELIPLYIRSEVSSFCFENCVEEIRRKYPTVDVATLIKKLEIKQDNYNRLMR